MYKRNIDTYQHGIATPLEVCLQDHAVSGHILRVAHLTLEVPAV